MTMLTATQTQPDYIALAIAVLLVLAFVIAYLRKVIISKKEVSAQEEIKEVAPPADAPGSAGQVKTYNVPPKTCAMLMAIVADKMGKPLNELRFISIKEVE